MWPLDFLKATVKEKWTECAIFLAEAHLMALHICNMTKDLDFTAKKVYTP